MANSLTLCNMSDILNGVNLNDNVIIDIKPAVSVKIDILPEKKVKLILNLKNHSIFKFL